VASAFSRAVHRAVRRAVVGAVTIRRDVAPAAAASDVSSRASLTPTEATNRWPDAVGCRADANAGLLAMLFEGRFRLAAVLRPNPTTRSLDGRGNTHVERDFGFEAIRKLNRESEHDISIGGAELAGLALEADLVDECHLSLNPVIVGGGRCGAGEHELVYVEDLCRVIDGRSRFRP
jgi:hypothetical protein